MDINMPVMDGITASKEIFKLINMRKISQSIPSPLIDDRKPKERLFQSNVARNKTPIYKHETNKKIYCKIVAVTAYQSEEIENKCKKAGISQVVAKPLNSKMLKAILNEYYFCEE